MSLADQIQQTIAEAEQRLGALTRAGMPMGPSSFTSERFVWRVTYRDGTIDSEENGEGFGRVFASWVARIEILIPQFTQLQGGEVGIHHDIPAGASAVFTRRRILELDPNSGLTTYWPGWTIIGHIWPDGLGQYFFYHNTRDAAFASADFNDPRAGR